MRRQFLGGLFGQGAGLASTLVIQLAQVPVLIFVLGSVGYGQYLITIAVPSLLVLTDFGLLAAFSTAMLQAVSAGQHHRARQLSRLAAAILFSVALVALVGLSAGAVVVHLGKTLPEWSPLVFFLYGLYALVGIQTNALEGIFRADGRQAKTWTFVAVLRVAEFGGAAAGLLVTRSVVAFVLGLLVVRVIGTAALWASSARTVPWASRRPSFQGWREHRGLIKPMIGSVAQPATSYVYLQGTVLVVGVVLGPAVVAQLGVLRTFSGLLKQLSQVFTLASIPLLTRASAIGDSIGARGRLRSTSILVSAALFPVAAALILSGPTFIDWWTAGDISVSTFLVAVFVFEAAAEVVLALATMSLVARNRNFASGLAGLFCALVYLAVILFVSSSGLIGVIMVQSISVLLTAGIAAALTWKGEDENSARG